MLGELKMEIQAAKGCEAEKMEKARAYSHIALAIIICMAKMEKARAYSHIALAVVICMALHVIQLYNIPAFI